MEVAGNGLVSLREVLPAGIISMGATVASPASQFACVSATRQHISECNGRLLSHRACSNIDARLS